MNNFKLFILTCMISFFGGDNLAKTENSSVAYDFTFNDLNGGLLKLSDYKNKIIVVVNVASQCGFTNQYKDMQNIWEKYQNKNIIILGVPSNDFGQQEPGTSKDIKNFCEAKFGITFPMTEKVSVKGDHAHPFYLWAKKNYGDKAVPKWNFHKIIIDKSGKITKTFSSLTNPSSSKFIKVLDELTNS